MVNQAIEQNKLSNSICGKVAPALSVPEENNPISNGPIIYQDIRDFCKDNHLRIKQVADYVALENISDWNRKGIPSEYQSRLQALFANPLLINAFLVKSSPDTTTPPADALDAELNILVTSEPKCVQCIEPPDSPGVINESQSISTFNSTLDSPQNYCTVDLLRHIDDGHLLKRLSIQTSAQTHLPMNTVFLMGLTVYSSMAARKYSVLYENGEALPIGLYSVAEQPSGTGKSRCLKTFEKPFHDAHHSAIIAAKKKIKLFDQKKESSEKLTKEEEAEYKVQIGFLKTGLFVTNATPEGLEKTLAASHGFFSSVSSEQGLFDSLLGCSYKSEGSSNNNDVVLNGFDGGHINSIRVTREGYHGNVVGGIACFAQQGSIEKVLAASNGTGLSERFLMLTESHSLGKRDHTVMPSHDNELIKEYSNACQFIEEIIEKPRYMNNLSNLIISDSGFLKINQYRNKIEKHLVDGGKFSHVSLRGAASKANMQIMKIAANLHLIDGGEIIHEIADRHVVSAISITNELLEANLRLCKDKGLLGKKAEFTSILSLFEKDQKPRSERSIIQSKSQKKPFRDFSGNKSVLIRSTLSQMVMEGLLIKDTQSQYKLAQ